MWNQHRAGSISKFMRLVEAILCFNLQASCISRKIKIRRLQCQSEPLWWFSRYWTDWARHDLCLLFIEFKIWSQWGLYYSKKITCKKIMSRVSDFVFYISLHFHHIIYYDRRAMNKIMHSRYFSSWKKQSVHYPEIESLRFACHLFPLSEM